MKKITTLLIQYGFKVNKNEAILADGSGCGSIRFAYSNTKEYVESYAIACNSFLDNLKNDFCKQRPSMFGETFNITFTFFTCAHSVTEECPIEPTD